MKNPLVGVDPRWLLYGGALVLLVVVGWQVKRAVDKGSAAAGELLDDITENVVPRINPADDRNFVYAPISAAGEAVTGERGWTLGGQLAEWFDPATREVNRQLGTKPAPTTGDLDTAPAAPWLNDAWLFP